MLLPSKVTSLNESIFPMAILLLKKLQFQNKPVGELFYECRKEISDVSDFFTVLDFLYAIGKIDLNLQTKELHYVA